MTLSLIVCAVLAGLTTGCQTTQAQKQRGISSVKVTDVDGYVELVARDRQNQFQSKVSNSGTDFQETIFEESLGLTLDGYVYHPNLMEYTLAGVFGLLQYDFERTTATEQFASGDNGNVNEFDLNTSFFKRKRYPGSVFARRYESLEARAFQSSLRTSTDNYGFLWRYVSEKTPTSIQFDHTDVKIDPLSDSELNGRQQNTTFRFETAYNFSDYNILSLVYDRKAVDEQPYAFSYDSDEIKLSHRYDFGARKRHSLESTVNYLDQRGTINLERLRWRELLRLRHTERLTSIYQFEYLDRTQGVLSDIDPITEESYYLAGTLEHDLYESLVSQFYAWAQTQSFDTGSQIDRYGAQANLDYRKKNKLGRLLASYRARFQSEERTGGVRDIQVVEERITFRDPDPVILQTQNIRLSSLRITDEARLTMYQDGVDYRTMNFADRIELERIPTGRIGDGDTVLISYTFTLGSDFVLDTINQQFRIRQNFDGGLSPYYQLRWQDQTLSPAGATGSIAEDITAHIFGVEYRWKGLRLSAEYEDHASTLNPFEALSLTADYRHRFKNGATGNVRARWKDISRGAPQNRDTEFFTIDGRYRHPIVAGLVVEGAVLYRQEQDSLSGPDEGIDFDLSLEWLVRQTEFRVTFEYGEFEDNFATSDHSTLYVQLRRNF